MKYRVLTLALAAALALGAALPASAFSLFGGGEESPASAEGAPIARDLELETYQNVAVTGRFDGVDPEGDLLTYHVVKKPARGAVTVGEDGSFVYEPYEDKKGKDSFTYVVVDPAGNSSDPATVKVRIQKPDTQVTYADLAGHPAHRAALRLAEEDLLVGEKLGEQWFFRPEQAMTRGEFLTLAMHAAGLEELEGVERTGFADDAAMETWAKPYVSSALKSGLVTGSLDETGQAVFRAGDPITGAEAAVLLDRALQITDVDAQTFAPAAPAWAAQSAANLSTCGMLDDGEDLSAALTRGEAAQLICSALELLDSRDTGWF